MVNCLKWFSGQIFKVVGAETGELQIYLSTANAGTQDDERCPNHWPLPQVSPTLRTLAWVSEQKLLGCLLSNIQTALTLRLLAHTPPLPLHFFSLRNSLDFIYLKNEISSKERLQLSKWGPELSFQPTEMSISASVPCLSAHRGGGTA